MSIAQAPGATPRPREHGPAFWLTVGGVVVGFAALAAVPGGFEVNAQKPIRPFRNGWIWLAVVLAVIGIGIAIAAVGVAIREWWTSNHQTRVDASTPDSEQSSGRQSGSNKPFERTQHITDDGVTRVVDWEETHRGTDTEKRIRETVGISDSIHAALNPPDGPSGPFPPGVKGPDPNAWRGRDAIEMERQPSEPAPNLSPVMEWTTENRRDLKIPAHADFEVYEVQFFPELEQHRQFWARPNHATPATPLPVNDRGDIGLAMRNDPILMLKGIGKDGIVVDEIQPGVTVKAILHPKPDVPPGTAVLSRHNTNEIEIGNEYHGLAIYEDNAGAQRYRNRYFGSQARSGPDNDSHDPKT